MNIQELAKVIAMEIYIDRRVQEGLRSWRAEKTQQAQEAKELNELEQLVELTKAVLDLQFLQEDQEAVKPELLKPSASAKAITQLRPNLEADYLMSNRSFNNRTLRRSKP